MDSEQKRHPLIAYTVLTVVFCAVSLLIDAVAQREIGRQELVTTFVQGVLVSAVVYWFTRKKSSNKSSK